MPDDLQSYLEKLETRIKQLEKLHPIEKPQRDEWLLVYASVLVSFILLVFTFGPAVLSWVTGDESMVDAATSTIMAQMASQALTVWISTMGMLVGVQMAGNNGKTNTADASNN